MSHGPPPRPAARGARAPRRSRIPARGAVAGAALCALLVAPWHAPALAQDGAGGTGDAVDLRERGAAAAAEAESAVVAAETLLFAFGARETDARHEAVLDALAARLAGDGALRVRIDAHTDNVGWALGNVELSRLRARAIASGLVDRGVDVARITARAFGESAPTASNATAEGRRRNRRAELLVLR